MMAILPSKPNPILADQPARCGFGSLGFVEAVVSIALTIHNLHNNIKVPRQNFDRV